MLGIKISTRKVEKSVQIQKSKVGNISREVNASLNGQCLNGIHYRINADAKQRTWWHFIIIRESLTPGDKLRFVKLPVNQFQNRGTPLKLLVNWFQKAVELH